MEAAGSDGSTHGQSRIIREAYFEHPLYVPLVRRSYECWQRLQADAGKALLNPTGAVLIGPAAGMLVAGTRLSADRYGLDYEMLTAGEVRKRGVSLPALPGRYRPAARLIYTAR